MSLRADNSVSSLSSGALHSVSSRTEPSRCTQLANVIAGREHVVRVGAEEGVAPNLAAALYAFKEEGMPAAPQFEQCRHRRIEVGGHVPADQSIWRGSGRSHRPRAAATAHEMRLSLGK